MPFFIEIFVWLTVPAVLLVFGMLLERNLDLEEELEDIKCDMRLLEIKLKQKEEAWKQQLK